MNVPVFGTDESPYPKPKTWQFSTSYRYQKSDRHFIGPDEQKQREAEGSQVVNRIHLIDVSLTYNVNERWNFTVGIPYFMAERSSPVRDDSRAIIDRSVTQARSISDVTVLAHRWMLDPATHKDGNVQLGLGLKLPTGEAGHLDVRKQFINGAVVTSIAPVDQSIQPGDGGFGVIVEGSWFQRLGRRYTTYASASYLFNPEETSTTDRGGTNPITQRFSIADAYIARFGLARSFVAKGSWTANLGGRLEGVPAKDLIGGDNGFRRPGYAFSVEPGITLVRGTSAYSLGVPVALYRNRTRSVADQASGGHGDAAFADYLILLSYTHAF